MFNLEDDGNGGAEIEFLKHFPLSKKHGIKRIIRTGLLQLPDIIFYLYAVIFFYTTSDLYYIFVILLL